MPLQRAPSAAADNATIEEATTVAIAVLANDSDPDGDALTVTGIDGQPAAPGAVIDLASGARVTVSTDGTVDYDPNGAFDLLRTGEQAEDSFAYTADDGRGSAASATATVTIQGSDDPVVTVADFASTTERTVTTIAVLVNDASAHTGLTLQVTAIDGVTITVAGTTTLASGASVTLNADQTLAYDPGEATGDLDAGEQVVDRFTYAVEDDAGDVGEAEVTVTVTGTNSAPVAVDDTAATDEEAPIRLDVLTNDQDAEADVLQIQQINGQPVLLGSIVALPSGAQVAVGVDGSITFDPRFGFDRLPAGLAVVDSFTYEVGDAAGGRDTALASVSVIGFDAPTVTIPRMPFHALEYTASYPDLIRAFGMDAAAAANHHQTIGYREGRDVAFDGLEYIASYADLALAFGADRDAGAGHYITNGFTENRAASFNALEYIASYSDLGRAFGLLGEDGARHYLDFGLAEGRTVIFDGLAYVAGYGDLIARLAQTRMRVPHTSSPAAGPKAAWSASTAWSTSLPIPT